MNILIKKNSIFKCHKITTKMITKEKPKAKLKNKKR